MKNMGNTDRIIRLVVGVLLIILLFTVDSGWKYLGLLGFVLVLTAAIGTCPLYLLFHMDTRPKTDR